MTKTSTIKIVDPLNYIGWDDQILQFEEYSIFHSSHWAKLLSHSYGYEPCYFIVEEDSVIKTVFPIMVVKSFLTGNRAVSLPFSDFCKPLISNEISLNSLINEIIIFVKNQKLKYLDFKDDEAQLPDINPFVFQYRHKLKLDKAEDKIFSSFRKGTKSSIKKAIKEGVQVQIENSMESIEKFCHMHHVTRRKHGLPPQPTSFFNRLYDYIISKNLGFIVLAKSGNQVLAGAVYLTFGRKILYKYSASLPESMKLMANNLVMWEAIKYSIKNKYEEIDFGISESDNEGLRIYKTGWGAKESKINLFRYSVITNNYIPMKQKLKGSHNKIFKKAPIPLIKVFSSIFYKHFA